MDFALSMVNPVKVRVKGWVEFSVQSMIDSVRKGDSPKEAAIRNMPTLEFAKTYQKMGEALYDLLEFMNNAKSAAAPARDESEEVMELLEELDAQIDW